MAGFQTAAVGNITVQRGRPPAPVVDIRLVRPEIAKVASLGAAAFRRPTDLTGAQVKEIKRQRAAGVPTREIARNMKVSRSTVAFYVRGIEAPAQGWSTGGHTSRLCPKQIAEMRAAGMTYRAIGAALGASETGVYNALNTRAPRYGQRQKLPIQKLVRAVAAATGIEPTDLMKEGAALCSGRASPEISRARHVLFWICRSYLPKKSYPAMALALGGFDHSSCIHGVQRVQKVVDLHGISRRKRPYDTASAIWRAAWPARKAA